MSELHSEPIGLIYKIENPFNGKIYVGQTWNRLNVRCSSPNSYKNCIKLYRAFSKYGFENFKREVVATANTQKELDDLEVFFIKKYDCINNGYNCQTGGSNGRHSIETRKKMSKAWKIRKMSEAWRTRPMPSDETKRKMSAARLGKRHSSETKRKMSERKRGEHAHTAKLTWEKVDRIRLEFGAGLSRKELAEKYGVDSSTIARILIYKTWVRI